MNKKVRAIAFYLPQFHPIPENDEWWGKDFTEWTNVKKAVPLYKGHHQPNLPGELGFYNLLDPEVREKQASLANDYGIEGFCYWHYWFGNGRRILEKVFDEVLASGKPDFPFCLAWANETWSGIWHGLKNKILIEQKYPGKDDYIAHFNYLIKAFKDNRYIKVHGKPFFVVYRPHEIPDIEVFVNVFREEASKNGLPGIYLVGHNAPDNWIPSTYGFDAVGPAKLSNAMNIYKRLHIKLKLMLGQNNDGPFVFDYRNSIDRMLPRKNLPYINFPCVISNWDNTPRSGKRGWILKNSTPEYFAEFLRKAIQKVEHYPKEERFVFLRSWNEWAEGNYLEPDAIYGRGYLDVCKKVLSE